MAEESALSKARKLGDQLWSEMEQNKTTWALIGEYVYPWRNQCISSNESRSEATRRSTRIITSAAGLAFNAFRAGMLAGNSSPSQRWFKIEAYRIDEDGREVKADSEEEKSFLSELEDLTYRDLAQSNAYRSLALDYGDQGLYGTAAMLVIADEEDPLRCYVFPIGSYAIGCDHRGVPNQFVRKIEMTASQMVSKWGEQAVSERVRQAIAGHRSEERFEVGHLIAPNSAYRKGSSLSTTKRFKECYYECGGRNEASGSDPDGKLLAESGYETFPVLVTRWNPAGGYTPWGVGPALEIIGDVMQLQIMTRDEANAIENEVNPALMGPGHLKRAVVNRRPGSFTAVDVTQGQSGVVRVWEPNLNLSHVELIIQRCEARINEALFKDLFKQFTGNPERLPKTAYLAQRMFQEKAGNLLPMMEQQYDELLGPLIDRVIQIRTERGGLPEMPESLLTAELRYEYISPFAEAQRAQKTGGTETFLSVVGQLAAAWPEALTKVDISEAVDELADGYSVPPAMIRDDEEVAAIHEAEAAAMEAQRAAQNLPAAAKAVKDLSQAPVDEESALTAAMSMGAM